MKRLMLLLRCMVVYCLVLSLFVGIGYAESKEAIVDGSTAIIHALEQADAVRNSANRTMALSRIAGTYLQNGHYDEALTVSEKITEPYAKSLLYLELSRLSDGHGADLVENKAMPVIEEIDIPAQQVFAWLKAAEACIEIPGLKPTGLKALDLALEKVEKVEDTQLRAARMTTMAEQNLAYGREAEALALLDKALEISQEKEDAHEHITVLDRVALGYLKAGKVQKASEVIADIEDPYARSAVYDRLAAYYASMGQFDKAAENTAAIERPYTRAYSWSRLAVAQQQAGNPGAVDESLKRAWMDAEKVGVENEQMDAEKEGVEKEQMDAEKVKDNFLRSSAMGQVAATRSAVDQVEDALALTEKIENELIKEVTLKKVAAGFAAKGQYDKAIALIDNMPRPYYQATTLSQLAEIALAAGNDGDAKKWLIRAAETSNEIKGLYQQHAARVEIANNFAAMGEFDQAIDLADLLNDHYHFVTALYNVTHQYTRQEKYDKAIQLSEAIDDPYYRASALTEIASALYKHGPIAFEKDPYVSAWVYGWKESVLKQAVTETAMNHVLPVSALVSVAVADSNTGSFYPQGGMLIADADRSFQKRRNLLEMGEDEEMKVAMDDVFKVLNTLVNDQNLDEDGQQQQFLVYLENIRHGKHHRFYFKANDLQGKILKDPHLPELEGKDLSDFPDADGNKTFLMFKRVGFKKGQAIVTHMWPKNELKNKSHPRISLVRIYEPWGMEVVTGYPPKTIEDFELYDNVIDDRGPASPI